MKRSNAGLSIFSRLLISLLGVVLLVSGLLTTIFYVHNRRALEKHTSENILQQFETISYHFRYELRDALVKDLQLLASVPALDRIITARGGRETDASEAEWFFLESLKYSRSYESISFVNRAGREVIKVDWSGRVRTQRDVGGRPLFRALKSGMPGGIDVEGPVITRYGDVVFSAGIQKTGAKLSDFSGAIVIDDNLKDFIDYLDKIKVFDENPLWLLLPNGTVVKQPVNRQAFLDPRPYLSKGFRREPVLVSVEGGVLVYQDLYINPEYPLMRLAISIPSSLLLQDLRAVLRFFLLVSAVSLLAISVLAYYLAGYLSRPIIELSQAASRLAKGDLSARVRGTSTGEVRLLIDSFNRMGQDLQRTTVSKEYMDNIVSSMMDTLIVVSPEGLIVRMNDAARVLLGYEEQELINKPIDSVIGEGPGGGMGLADILAQGSISVVEKSYLTKSGKTVPVLFSASVMRDTQGTVQGIVCVAQDITARKRDEARLRAYSEELQEINEDLQNLAYIVSHDLRAPLVNIKGFSEELIMSIREMGPLLEKYLAGFDQDERNKFGDVLKKDIPEALHFIGSSVNRMDNLINAVLKLSRAGRRKLSPEPVSACRLVQDILDSIAHQIGSRNACVVVHELPDVVADKTALEQIFGNLLDNSVKYLEPGREGKIEILGQRRDGEVLFHVRDNGRGMAREDIPRAFEIFRRVGRQDVPGEGMGLAYVKALVRLHGGRIWCESEPGVGTTFSFTIPRQHAG